MPQSPRFTPLAAFQPREELLSPSRARAEHAWVAGRGLVAVLCPGTACNASPRMSPNSLQLITTPGGDAPSAEVTKWGSWALTQCAARGHAPAEARVSHDAHRKRLNRGQCPSRRRAD